jgi:RNA polymerase sigma factor (sigma-70 family)
VTVLAYDPKAFITDCVRGDAEARTAFQEQYGPLIYSFPVRIFHLPEDEAGNFYLYVFEQERIFRRIRSFEGRNAIQFETYLSYYVLRDLFLEWVRTTERVDVVSLELPIAGNTAGDGARTPTLQDVLAAEDPTPDAVLEEADATREVQEVLDQLDAEKRLILKLLNLGAVDLAPDDVRLLAQTASCSIREALERVEEVASALSAKTSKAQEKRAALHAVSHWIHTYQRRIAALEEDIRVSRLQGNAQAGPGLTHDKAELERKLAWRYRQQARLRQELEKFDIRPAYKDIARLLNLSLGTVCSRIARAREEFGHRLARARDMQA